MKSHLIPVLLGLSAFLALLWSLAFERMSKSDLRAAGVRVGPDQATAFDTLESRSAGLF